MGSLPSSTAGKAGTVIVRSIRGLLLGISKQWSGPHVVLCDSSNTILKVIGCSISDDFDFLDSKVGSPVGSAISCSYPSGDLGEKQTFGFSLGSLPSSTAGKAGTVIVRSILIFVPNFAFLNFNLFCDFIFPYEIGMSCHLSL